VAVLGLRIPDQMLAQFDAWAGGHGGRSPALRHLIRQASAPDATACDALGPLGRRPVQLTVRLTSADARGLDAAAAEVGLARATWAAALIRRRLAGRPTFRRSDELSLIATLSELRRIAVSVSQIARGLNTAGIENRARDAELARLDDLRAEIRGHMAGLYDAFEGNLAYWGPGP